MSQLLSSTSKPLWIPPYLLPVQRLPGHSLASFLVLSVTSMRQTEASFRWTNTTAKYPWFPLLLIVVKWTHLSGLLTTLHLVNPIMSTFSWDWSLCCIWWTGSTGALLLTLAGFFVVVARIIPASRAATNLHQNRFIALLSTYPPSLSLSIISCMHSVSS